MTSADAWSIHVQDEVESTNDAVLSFPLREGPGGTALFAESQSMGRGRRGNPWIGEPAGANLLFSCALRPVGLPVRRWSRLTHGTSLAMKRVLESFPTLRPQVKWPNDVYLNGRKVAGILVESEVRENAESAVAVIGVGLNVNVSAEDIPEALKTVATSLRVETQTWFDRERLAGDFLDALTEVMEILPHSFGAVLEELKLSHYLLNRSVRARLGGTVREGRAVDLGPEGELILETGGGERLILTSADEVRPLDGADQSA